jgi:hypothetical protein
MKKHLTLLAIGAVLLTSSVTAKAADWSSTELQYQYSHLRAPAFAGGAESHPPRRLLAVFDRIVLA